MLSRVLPVLCIALLLVLGGVTVHASPFALAGQRSPMQPPWVQWDAASRTARVTIVASYDEANAGFNFNGCSHGRLTVSVPRGARVVVSFINRAEVPQSVVITALENRGLARGFPPAFPGSASPTPETGVAESMTPLTFSFVAATPGHYAIVSGIPGYAIGGMWDRFDVGDVPDATFVANEDLATPWRVVTRSGDGAGGPGAMEGMVTDASTGLPVPGALVVLGWSTIKRVGETAAHGYYRIDNIKPVALVDAYGFAQGYLYYHGHPIPTNAGRVTVYSFRLPRQAFPRDLLPVITQATVSATTAAPGSTVMFEAHITPGQHGPLSVENFAVSGRLGISVLLLHVGNDVYRGTWRIPWGIKPGSYQFRFITTMESCLENEQYPQRTLRVGS